MTLDLDALHARLWRPTCSQCGSVDPPTERGEGMDGRELERHVGCPKPDDLFASEVGDHGLTRDEQRALLDEARRLRAQLDALALCVRREHNARLAWLATLPDGAAPTPSAAVDAAWAATREALREVL